jgi:outer membrane protein assembly factor BamB
MASERHRSERSMARFRVAGIVSIAVLAVGCAPPLDASNASPSAFREPSVVTYRGDAARTGSMPGPAPSGTPRIAWTFEAGAPIGSSPLVVDGVVFVGSDDGVIHALTLDTGAERWQAKLGADATASPLIAGGLLVIGDSAGTVHALDVADGSARWTLATDGPVSGAAASDGIVAVVGTTTGSAYAIDVVSGGVRWKTVIGGSVSTSVAIADGLVFLGASPSLTALALGDGSVRWTQAISPDGRIGTPTAAGGLVYAATGLDAADDATHGVMALDAATGEERWRFGTPTATTVYTPAVVDGRAYIVGEDHSVVALDADDGTVIWTSTTDELNEAVAAVADGLVIVAGNGGAIHALDAATGAIEWTVPYRGTPYGPIVVGGYVLVGTNLGTLIAIGGS